MRAIRRSGSSHRQIRTLAERADRYSLYQKSVQDPAWEMGFVEDVFYRLRGRAALHLREDFCGTAYAACEWVRRNTLHTAIGIDLDPEVLDWGNLYNLSKLSPSVLKRLTLLQADVKTVNTKPVDLILAFNFSYWIFKQRQVLCEYFRNVRASLLKDGIFMLDAYGGYDAFHPLRERQDFGRFTYIWEQADYEPITGATTCHIHFSFPDGSKLRKAFSYDWRLWTLPELQEVLIEAGFRRVNIYWEGIDDETGQGNGEFTQVMRGEADAGWIAYLVAEC